MDVGDAELVEVVEAIDDAGNRAGEAVDVEDVADHRLAEEPVRLEVALEVEPAEFLRPRRPAFGEDADQVVGEARVVRQVAVEPRQRAEQILPAPRKPHLEQLAVVPVEAFEGIGGAGGQSAIGSGVGSFRRSDAPRRHANVPVNRGVWWSRGPPN